MSVDLMEKIAQTDVEKTAWAATMSMAYVTLDVSQDGRGSLVKKVGLVNHICLLYFTVFVYDYLIVEFI